MKRTLYLKFLLAYLIFGVFGFIIVSSFVSQTMYQRLLKEQASTLYREANLIANTYAADLYTNSRALDEVKEQLDNLASFMSTTIWRV